MTGVNEVFTWDGGVSDSQTRPHVDHVARLVSSLWPVVSRPPPTATATCHWPRRTTSPSPSWLYPSTGRHCPGDVTSLGPGPSHSQSTDAAGPGRPRCRVTLTVPAVVGRRPYNKTHDIYSDCHLRHLSLRRRDNVTR